MPEYVFAYHGGKKPETPEAGAELMARWQAWIAGLGDAMTNPGNPVGKSKTVSSDRAGSGILDTRDKWIFSLNSA